jgi:hypothetical protein
MAIRYLPMRRLTTLIVLVAASVTLAQTGPALTPPPAERIKYRKPLPGGRELVVVQQPVLQASVMNGLLSKAIHRRTSGLYCVDLELRSPANPPLRVWSRQYVVERPWDDDAFHVLDMLVLSDRVVLVEATIDIGIQEIWLTANEMGLSPYNGPSRAGSLLRWSMISAAIPAAPGRLSAKLAHNALLDRVEVQVTDFLENTKQHTSFVQKPGAWEFALVKQWRENVPPTTKPSSAHSP